MATSHLVIPDGGWGWVVAVASSFIYFLSFGITSIGGLLMLALTRQIFPDGRSKAIWIPVLCNGMSRLFAPVAVYLSAKTSYRTIIFLGGILMTLGYALSYSANSIDLLFGYFGIIVGIGVSFCIYPTAILTTLYFDKHASLANGIYTAGQAFGCIIFPLCVDSFFTYAGVRDTFLYLGGIGLQICVAATLCQPVEWHMKKTSTKAQPEVNGNSEETIETPYEKLEIEENDTKNNSKSFYSKSAFYYLSLGCTAMYLNMATFPIIIPDFAMEAIPDTGSLERTAFLLSAGAAADFVTRSGFSWVFDLKFINRNYCFFASTFLGGMAVLLCMFVPNFLSILFCCMLCGISSGVCSILVAVTYKENLGTSTFGLALTVSSLVSGVLTIVVGSIVGPLRTLTGSYNIMLIIIGGYQVTGVLIWLLSRFCVKKSEKPVSLD